MVNYKKKLDQSKNDLEKYNAAKAHEEMVDKSGGGLNNILQLLDTKNSKIEILTQHIARLNIEINNMENQIIEMAVIYKFKNSFIAIEINKFFLKEKIKKKFKKIKKLKKYFIFLM